MKEFDDVVALLLPLKRPKEQLLAFFFLFLFNLWGLWEVAWRFENEMKIAWYGKRVRSKAEEGFRGFGVELLLLSNPLRPPEVVYILRKIGEVNEGKKKLVTGRSRKTHTFDRFSQGKLSGIWSLLFRLLVLDTALKD